MSVLRTSLRPTEGLQRGTWAVLDGAWWAVAILFGSWVRYQYDHALAFTPGIAVVAVLAALTHVAFGCLLGPYLVRHVRGSFEEVLTVMRAAVLTGLTLQVLALAADPVIVPRSVPALATGFALSSMLGPGWSCAPNATTRPGQADRPPRAVFGAGAAGRHLLTTCWTTPRPPTPLSASSTTTLPSVGCASTASPSGESRRHRRGSPAV